MTGKVIQLEFPECEKLQILNKQDEFNRMATKSIRGLFARYNELEMTTLEMHKKLDNLTEALFKNA